MKKFYAFFAAALMSVSVFAAPASVPTATNLSDAGYDVNNNVVLCVYFDVAPCNPVVLAGNYNADAEWTIDPTVALNFKALAGFDGWYAVQFPWKEGVMAKPVQLKVEKEVPDLKCWDYQAGDPAAWAHMGGLEATITNGYEGESNVAYPQTGAYIYELAYWKNNSNPCVYVPKYKYTIILFEPYCDDKEYAPGVTGNFDSWQGTAMSKTVYEGDEAYMYVVEDEADHYIKFREATCVGDDWTNELQYLNEQGIWVNFGNYQLPKVTKDTTLIFDYSDTEKYRYTLCAPEEPLEYTVLFINFPKENAPESIEIIGTFDDWAGTAMEKLENGLFFVEFEAKASQYFKFRGAGSWDQELEVYDTEEDTWRTIQDNELIFSKLWQDYSYKGTSCKTIEGGEWDLSDPDSYRWKAPEGIENVVLTEKARKVVVDGAIYIVRDNKLFNLQGAQVR